MVTALLQAGEELLFSYGKKYWTGREGDIVDA